MHVDQEIDPDRRSVVLTVTGKLSDEGLLGLADVLEKIRLADNASVLIDLRLADGVSVTAAGVRKMAARRLVLSPDSRRAVVVPSALGFGMARMYALIRGTGSYRVFMDYQRARQWVETAL